MVREDMPSYDPAGFSPRIHNVVGVGETPSWQQARTPASNSKVFRTPTPASASLVRVSHGGKVTEDNRSPLFEKTPKGNVEGMFGQSPQTLTKEDYDNMEHLLSTLQTPSRSPSLSSSSSPGSASPSSQTGPVLPEEYQHLHTTLRTKEEELVAAAELGLRLLEENRRLQAESTSAARYAEDSYIAVDQLNQRISELEKQNYSVQCQLDGTNAKYQALRHEYDVLSDSLFAVEKENHKLECAVEGQKVEMKEHHRRLSSAQESLVYASQVEYDVETLRGENNTLKKEVREMQAQLSDEVRAHQKTLIECDTNAGKVEELASRLRHAMAEERRVDDNKAEVRELARQLNCALEENDRLERAVASLTAEKGRLEAEKELSQCVATSLLQTPATPATPASSFKKNGSAKKFVTWDDSTPKGSPADSSCAGLPPIFLSESESLYRAVEAVIYGANASLGDVGESSDGACLDETSEVFQEWQARVRRGLQGIIGGMVITGSGNPGFGSPAPGFLSPAVTASTQSLQKQQNLWRIAVVAALLATLVFLCPLQHWNCTSTLMETAGFNA